MDGGSLGQRPFDQSQSLLGRPASKCASAVAMSASTTLGFSEFGQLSASFLEQDQACWYVAGPALRPTHFLAYQGYQSSSPTARATRSVFSSSGNASSDRP